MDYFERKKHLNPSDNKKKITYWLCSVDIIMYLKELIFNIFNVLI